MAVSPNPLVRFFSALLWVFRAFRAVVLNLLFLFVVIILFSALVARPGFVVPQDGALVLNPSGFIVEQRSFANPLDRILNEAANAPGSGEVLLQDILDVIAMAQRDTRISALILDTNYLAGGGFSHLQDIAHALQTFRSSGKKVYAVGGNYTQAQYYLASQADVVMLNSYGSVGLEGFSAWQNYFGEALDKLGINVHIFRVGEYKSAVEPYERNDMSPEAKANYSTLLNDLWQLYVNDITSSRELPAGLLEDLINNQDRYLAEHDGNGALMALENGLVDRVETEAESLAFLNAELGGGPEGFAGVEFLPYLRTQSLTLPGVGDQVGVLVASGNIVDGEAPQGTIGGDSLAGLIRRVKDDTSIKALVLRVDSGGGSAFASEIIRAELASFRATGRPVVVSMGSVAASGGYWIATPADQIWASPSTITGSIGIFGIYPTFEQTFGKLGIGTDGVSTTALAGYTTVGRELTPLAERSLQLTVEHGYDRFLNLVAESRDMSVSDVDAVAQGQVWSGQTAQSLGLVDNLGSLDEAIDAAAALAGLDSFGTRLIEVPLSPAQQLLQQFVDNTQASAWLSPLVGSLRGTSALERWLAGISDDLNNLLRLNDPNALYLKCLECGNLGL